jgi:hypothetical protein
MFGFFKYFVKIVFKVHNCKMQNMLFVRNSSACHVPTGFRGVEIRKQSAIGTEYSSCNLNTSGNREEKVGQ